MASNDENRNPDMASNGGNSNGEVDRRLEAMRPPEILPRNERLGGYIFLCNIQTMQEHLTRQIFGLTHRYQDSVRGITPGLPLFLYNFETGQLHGIFEATSFGSSNIDPSLWPDNNDPGRSRYPSQVRVRRTRTCAPMDDAIFRPFVHPFASNRFRLDLTVREAFTLLSLFNGRNR